MKFTISFLVFFMLAGCIAPRVQSPDVPVASDNTVPFTAPWDEDIDPDSVYPVEPVIPEENKKGLKDLLGEDNIGYHFRKTRWGFPRERVELSEVGNKVHKRTPQVLVYQCKINEVNCALVYTFEDNKLRTAGYITVHPVPNADNLRKAVVEKYGPPDGQETYEDGPNAGLREMIWTTKDTVIFSNLAPTVKQQTLTTYDRTPGGLFKDLLEKQREEDRAGNIVYYSGVHAHIDKAFFYELQERRYLVDALSVHEKVLTGVLVPGQRTIIPGLGTIPR